MIKRKSGFTLIEILIALFIFSIISIIFATALQSIFKAKSRIAAHVNQLDHLQLTLLLMQRDLSQVIDPTPNLLYAPRNMTSTFFGNNAALTFFTSSFTNPLGLEARSNIQRVEYHLDGKHFVRTTWGTLYPAKNDHGSSRVLLSDVKAIRFRYWSMNHLGYEQWPPVNYPNIAPPAAVLFTLTTTNDGAIAQTYNIMAERINHV